MARKPECGSTGPQRPGGGAPSPGSQNIGATAIRSMTRSFGLPPDAPRTVADGTAYVQGVAARLCATMTDNPGAVAEIIKALCPPLRLAELAAEAASRATPPGTYRPVQ